MLDDIVEQVKRSGIGDARSLRERTATPAVHEMLLAKVAKSRWIDVATIVAANGDVINFTRTYPPPQINLADRDYFQAHATNPGLGEFISAPVRNRGNGQWTF